MDDDHPILNYAQPGGYRSERPAPPVKDYGNVVFSHKTCAQIEYVGKWVALAILICFAALIVLFGVVAFTS